MNNIHRLLAALVFSVPLVLNASALSQEQRYQNNVGWAQSAQQGITNQAQGHLNVNDYCADAACVSGVHNPPQSGLSSAQINDQKTTEFFSNEQAGAIQDNFNKGKPNVQNDPAYEFALIGQEHAFDIAHGNSNPYVDCESGQQCYPYPVTKKCNAPTNNPVPCERVPVATVDSIGVTYVCESGWTLDGIDCRRTRTECRYDFANRYYQRGGIA